MQRLTKLKEHNRTSAREIACSIATATAAIVTAGDDVQSDDAGITEVTSNQRVKELLDRRQQRQLRQQQQRRDAATPGPSGLSRTAAPAAPPPPHPAATSSTATGVRVNRKRPVETVSSKSTRAWQQNPNRKWHRTYFVDAEGSTPQPNNDVARRAEWLEDVTSSLPPDILIYTCCIHNEETANDGSRIDESAQEGKCAIGKAKRKTGAEGGDTDIRSTNSSSLQQQKQTRKKKLKVATSRGNPLTAQERASVRTTFVESGGYPDWSRIHVTSGSADTVGGTKATAWDCFRYIQKEASSLLLAASAASAHVAAGSSHTPAHTTNATVVASAAAATASASSKKSSLPSQPWGSDEDSILLTAVMSLGPQCALTRDTVCNLARELFGDRSVKQIKKRANESLVNPNYRSTAVRWTDEEERMLVLLMKSYGHCPNPLVKVFAHFPNVASKSVAEKWMRLQRTNNTNNNKGGTEITIKSI